MPGPEARIRDRFRKHLPARYFRMALPAGARTGRGRSDDFIIAAGKPIAVEWKSEHGVATPKQLEFVQQIRAAGGFAFITREASAALKAITWITEGRLPYREDDMSGELDFLLADDPPSTTAPPVAETVPDVVAKMQAEGWTPSEEFAAATPTFESAVQAPPVPPAPPTPKPEPQPSRSRSRSRGRPRAQVTAAEVMEILREDAEAEIGTSPAPNGQPRRPQRDDDPPPVTEEEVADWSALTPHTTILTLIAALHELTFEISSLRSEMAAQTARARES